MTAAFLARQRTFLLDAALDLKAAIQRGRSAVQVDRHAEAIEEALEIAARDQAARDIDRSRKMLRLVEAALDRIQHADYGDCDRCGAFIGAKRLEAVPWATHCRACAELAETRQYQEVVA